MKNSEVSMHSAFKTRFQFLLFLAIFFFFIAFPFLPKETFIDRADIYRTLPPLYGSWEYFLGDVTNDPEPIDILFVGDSSVARSIDPRIMRDHMREQLGREPKIYAFSHAGQGFDLDLIFLNDLLKHKKVKLIILQDEARIKDLRRWTWIQYLWDLNQHWQFVKDLPLPFKFSIFGDSVASASRILLLTLRAQGKYAAISEEQSPSQRSLQFHQYYGAKLGPELVPDRTKIISEVLDPEVITLRRGQANSLFKVGPSHNSYQKSFFDNIIQLASKKNIALAFIYIPLLRDDPDYVLVRDISVASPGYSIPTIGVSLDQLFPGIDSNRFADFYQADGKHMTTTAGTRFSESIVKAISKLYEKTKN